MFTVIKNPLLIQVEFWFAMGCYRLKFWWLKESPECKNYDELKL